MTQREFQKTDEQKEVEKRKALAEYLIRQEKIRFRLEEAMEMGEEWE